MRPALPPRDMVTADPRCSSGIAVKRCHPSNDHSHCLKLVCPPGVPQILGCVKRRHFEDVELVVARPRGSGGLAPNQQILE